MHSSIPSQIPFPWWSIARDAKALMPQIIDAYPADIDYEMVHTCSQSSDLMECVDGNATLVEIEDATMAHATAKDTALEVKFLPCIQGNRG